MRINEILVESKLDEGPLGSLVKAAGRGVGNVIGGVAGAAGAVKGAAKGAVDRAKSSFKAGEKGAYDTLAGKPAAPTAGGTSPDQTQANLAKTGNPVAAPGNQAAPAPAEKPGLLKKIGQAVGDFKAGFQQGSGQAAPTAATPAASSQASTSTAPAPAATASADAKADPNAAPAIAADTATTPAANQKADTAYRQAQKAIGSLAPEQKKELVTMIQSDPKVKAALAKQAEKKSAMTAGNAAQTQTTKIDPRDLNKDGTVDATEKSIARNKAKLGGQQSVKITGRKQPAEKEKLAASKENLGNIVAESFSIFRKH